MLKILLIHANTIEKTIISRLIRRAGYDLFMLDQSLKYSDGLKKLNQTRYDLVLLDNNIANDTTSRSSASFIKSYLQGAPLAIISNNICGSPLTDPDRLGVDFIIDKENLSDFMQRLLPILPHISAEDYAIGIVKSRTCKPNTAS